jgi:hypothetical protein
MNEWSYYLINITEPELLTIVQLLGVKEIELAGNSFGYKFTGESERKIYPLFKVELIT